jgi:O-6-methylguanine DNA methyltransferase
MRALATRPIRTPRGVFVAHYSAAGLARLDFPGRKAIPATPASTPAVRRWHKQAVRAVARVLQGRAAGELPPLDLAAGTPFQQRVWAALRQIPAGQTESYGRLAAALGAPKAARAVGSACGANPIPLLIPCHRVLPSGGGLGGFSGGLQWKRLLLAREAGAAAGVRLERKSREASSSTSPRNGTRKNLPYCPAASKGPNEEPIRILAGSFRGKLNLSETQ